MSLKAEEEPHITAWDPEPSLRRKYTAIAESSRLMYVFGRKRIGRVLIHIERTGQKHFENILILA